MIKIYCEDEQLFLFNDDDINKIFHYDGRIVLLLNYKMEFYEKEHLFECVDSGKQLFAELEDQTIDIRHIFLGKRTTDDENDVMPIHDTIIICY